jgi:predicted acylesterase/phospholipase RssA
VFGREHEYLVLSGGAANGAFGAGLLNGWTDAGDRPDFEVVTGVSTGALIAPFAFLGSDYDMHLKSMYTQTTTADLIEERGVIQIVTGDALTSTDNIRNRLRILIDENVMNAIAAEARKGRGLFIGTTNLDAGRPVVWNIGMIAASGAPNALQMIHDVILASTAAPVAFPPVMIEVEANGRIYDEMHVDGGINQQLFLYPMALDWQKVMTKLEVQGTPDVYVIRNGTLQRRWQTVDRKIVPIADQAIFTLLDSAVLGDLYRLFLATTRDGLSFHLASIPPEFNHASEEPFDPEYMGALFNLGYEMARNGYPWQTTPPDYVPTALDVEATSHSTRTTSD